MKSNDVALSLGYELLEYRIESTLGVGGFGITYLATDTNLNLRIALKEYFPGELAHRADDQSVIPKSDATVENFSWGLTRFLDESRTLASFRHPNIVRVMRYFQANKTAYMVMEFVTGQALSDWVHARPPSDEAAARAILLPLLDGLSLVHQSGYLHRDIKPSNIFMRDDGTPVLLDFGSAREAGGELTALVTPGYAPIEQYHAAGKQGPWSDLYAFGGVLYWLVTSRKPVDAMARIRKDPMVPAVEAGSHERYSVEFLALIDWMLNPVEDQRPQSVDDLKRALIVNPSGQHLVSPIEPGHDSSFSDMRTPRATIVSTAPSVGFTGVAMDPRILKALELELTKHIGPIAAITVRSAAKKAPTITALVTMLSREMESEAARIEFVKRFANSAALSDTTSPNALPPTANTKHTLSTVLTEPRFELSITSRAEVALAKYLGPLARILVKRAAVKAQSESELYALIAEEIEDSTERKSFIREATTQKP